MHAEKIFLIDYLIIGQGIAGTMLAYFFEKRGISFKIVDAVDYHLTQIKQELVNDNLKHPSHGASNVSTGIINPVTGRRFVKSWMIDSLFPFAENTYQAIEKKLGIAVYKKIPLYRTVPDQKAMNDFLLRLDDPAYQHFFSDNIDFQPNNQHFNITKKGMLTTQSARVDVLLLLKAYRKYLVQINAFMHENINFNHIQIEADKCTIQFNNKHKQDFKRLVFCEGYRVKDNPFFNFLPLTSSNGQSLVIECPQLQLDYLLKSGIYVIPISKQQYQIGTTWDWDINKPTTTQAGYEDLQKKLSVLLKVPFNIINHKAAVRPTIKDRRPVIGKHFEHNNIFILNGLGSKGVSLSPYFAQQLVSYLLEDMPLIKEVSINRFYKFY